MVELQLDAWREAFVPILPASFRLPDSREFAPRLAEALGAEGVRSTLALERERLAGWISFGANRDLDAAPGTAEVRAIFIRPAAWRSGVGAALMGHALTELAGEGYTAATLWSFESNQGANAFYERHGFERDGGQQRREFSAGALEVRYRRALQ